MPTLRLTNLATYRDYFTNIATQHIGISGFKWGEKKVLMNDNRSDLADTFLWALPYEAVRYGDAGSDNVVKVKKARVSYMEARNSALFEDEDEQYDDAELVAEEIMARILRDKRGEDVAGVWTMIATVISAWTLTPVRHTLGSTHYIGWELSIDFLDNTNLAFNSEKWSDTLTP